MAEKTRANTVTCRSDDGLLLQGDAFGPEDGPPVLFMHGGGQTRHSWGGTAQAMAARGWRALTVDHRGHGDSDWSPDGLYGYDDHAADARAWARLLGGSPVVIGASLGGMAGMVATGHEPRLQARALILVDIAPLVEPKGADRIIDFMSRNMEQGFASLVDAAAEVAAYTPERKRAVDLNSIRKNLRARDGRWYWHWDPKTIKGKRSTESERITDVLSHGVTHADCPILLVRGRFSDVVSPDSVDHLMKLRPDTGFVDVGGAGHMVAGDRNDVFTDAVLGFLEERGIMQNRTPSR